MAKQDHQERWLRDIAERQQNITFPDAAQNEAHFWRTLIHGKRRLTALQIVVITLFALAAISLAMFITLSYWRPNRPWSTNLLAVVANWGIGLACIGGILLLIRWTTRKR
jgi:hypothetical protein